MSILDHLTVLEADLRTLAARVRRPGLMTHAAIAAELDQLAERVKAELQSSQAPSGEGGQQG